VLRLEDVLPLLGDFASVDAFREAMCAVLRDNGVRHADMRREMEDFTEASERIRYDCKSLQNRYGYLGSEQACDICGTPVQSRAFFLFPCTHVFHSDCMAAEMKLHLSTEQIAAAADCERRQQQLLRQLQDVRAVVASSGGLAKVPTGSSSSGGTDKESELLQAMAEQRQKFDSIVASQCLFCGDIMIASTSQPFVTTDEEKAAALWKI